MTLEHLLEIREKQGLEQGLQQGLEQGLEQGKEQLSFLVQKLLEENRLDEIQKVTTDPEYRELLLKEYCRK